MRRHWTVALALAATLLAGLFAAPAAPAAEAFGLVRKDYVVKTRHGKLFVEIAHPTRNGKIVKSPTILTLSPYTALYIGFYGTATGDSQTEDWVGRGYSRAVADVVGTGNSGGCYDYGGKREKETGHDLVEWMAKQKWSTGKIGMIGGSYDGTTATATATQAPTGLKTIIPEAAISRWYEYAYSGGIRYFLNNEDPSDEGFDTPLAFDFGLAVPPPVDVVGDDWISRVQDNMTPCEEIEHTNRGYDDTPDYDRFWMQRDYIKDAGNIRIPVLVAHNWGDWNVKQEEAWNLFKALKNSPAAKLYMGSRYGDHGVPSGEYDNIVDAWLDHYLKGVDNGIQKLARITSETANYDKALSFLSAPSAFKTRNVELIAQETAKTNPDDYEWKLLPSMPQNVTKQSTPATFLSAGINTESHANHHARSNHDWFWFESPHLKKDTRIFGEIKVKVWSSAQREWLTMTPTILDINPDCHTTVANQHNTDPTCLPRSTQAITRGFLDSRYRNGLDKQVPIKPGQPFGMTVVQKPTDYIFKKGHYIGLQIQTEINEWAVPKPYPCTTLDCTKVRVHWEKGQTRVVLPIVNAPSNPSNLFESAGHDH